MMAQLVNLSKKNWSGIVALPPLKWKFLKYGSSVSLGIDSSFVGSDQGALITKHEISEPRLDKHITIQVFASYVFTFQPYWLHLSTLWLCTDLPFHTSQCFNLNLQIVLIWIRDLPTGLFGTVSWMLINCCKHEHRLVAFLQFLKSMNLSLFFKSPSSMWQVFFYSK